MTSLLKEFEQGTIKKITDTLVELVTANYSEAKRALLPSGLSIYIETIDEWNSKFQL